MRKTALLAFLFALTVVLGLAAARGGAEAREPAARFIRASLAVDGREILESSTSDDGHPDVDEVWGYLRGLEFTPTAEFEELGLAPDAPKLLLEKKGEPRAIVLEVGYGGEVRTGRLELERGVDGKGKAFWKLAPAEIERLFPYRLISRAEAARLREPKRAR